MHPAAAGTNGSAVTAPPPPVVDLTNARRAPSLERPALRPDGFQSVTECIRYYLWDLVTMEPKPGHSKLHIHNIEFHCEEAAKKAQAHGFDTDAKRVKGILSNIRVQYRVAREALAGAAATQPAVAETPLAPVVQPAPAPATDLPEDHPLRDTLVALEEKMARCDQLFNEIADVHSCVRAAADELKRARVIQQKYEQLRAALTA